MQFYDRIYKVGKKKMAKKVCDGHNYVDYATTDASMKYVQDNCPECTHLLVTNGDNVYSSVRHVACYIAWASLDHTLHTPHSTHFLLS
jgi:hypothetical protein